MGEKIDIYNRKHVHLQILKKFKECEVSAKNKELILKFHEDCFAEGLSLARIDKYICTLKRLAILLGKDFDKADKEDIKELVKTIQLKYDSEWTVRDFKITLKKFYKWLAGTEECPEKVKWIKAGMKNCNRKLPSELLTEDEVKMLIEAAQNARDKALISTLYESGARVGEIGTLQIKHLVFDSNGCCLTVSGKTGMRRIRLISSKPYLAKWKNSHPQKNNPNAPLFIQLGHKRDRPMTYASIAKMIREIAKVINLKKPTNPHAFRHSRATYLAGYLTESQMKAYLGWVQDSSMAAIYVHLRGRDVDDAIMKIYGLAKKTKKEEASKLSPKVCQICEEVNESTAQRCNKCGTALTLKEAISLDKKEEIRKNDEEAVLLAMQQNMNTLFEKLYVLEERFNDRKK